MQLENTKLMDWTDFRRLTESVMVRVYPDSQPTPYGIGNRDLAICVAAGKWLIVLR